MNAYTLLRGAVTPEGCDALLEAAGERQRIVMPHRTVPAFLLGMKVCANFARPALGDDISGLGSDFFAASAGFRTHTDNDFVKAVPGTFVSVWLALADVTERNGPLVIDGRPILCAKGDAILIDGDTPHRSCAGHGPRPVALFTYIKRGWPFEAGETQQRSEVPL